jgi:ERCC4-type nuclease
MNYDEVSSLAQQLSYRDKLRLAQVLIQLARREEEEQNPDKRAHAKAASASDPELLRYVAERLRKLQPSKKETVLNSIGAMFQFQGGISNADKEKLFSELLKKRLLSVDANYRVQYPSSEV